MASPLIPSHRRRSRHARAILLGVAAALYGATPAEAATDPLVAPVTTLSPDGRSGTDGQRTLVASQVADLDPDGSTISVSGSGYDSTKGIYVALCAIPPRNVQPTPCGGGVDKEGTQQAAQWISSNPPPAGAGIARPYGPQGTFSASFAVRAVIAPGIDCRQIRCALVTRNDHTRSADRSQDIMLPVHFRAVGATVPAPSPGQPATGLEPAAPTTSEPAPVAPPPLANPTTTAAAPTTTIAQTGTSVTDGTRTLRADKVRALDPDEDRVTVRGEGFDVTTGIYVGLCAIGEPGATLGPCRTGTPRANRWVSSDPPAWGTDHAVPYEADGRFTVDVDVAAVIDSETDCRLIACAIVARADDTAGRERSPFSLALPVSFASGQPANAATTGGDTNPTLLEAASTGSPADSDDGSSGGRRIATIVLAVLIVFAGGATAVALRRRTTERATALQVGDES